MCVFLKKKDYYYVVCTKNISMRNCSYVLKLRRARSTFHRHNERDKGDNENDNNNENDAKRILREGVLPMVALEGVVGTFSVWR